jgi:EAL domain-containing protein (putative c-di-GMP-specific phosphodiesterase class I)
MKNHNVAIKIIESLKEKGFHFAIDDFGTGYSSLSYLKYFKIDKLKIDKSFILDAPYDRDDALIAKTIVDLAKTFKLKVQAEGVEESVHEDFVKTIGCDFGQGYFYSKPIKFSELCDEFIRKQL